jgi:threonine-phosphate decarboxylase
VDFSASINPRGLSPAAKKAAKAALALAPAYPEPSPNELVAVYADRCGVDPERVVAGNGSADLLFLLPRVLAPGKAIIVEPAFSEYRASLNAAGVEVESFLTTERDGFLPRIDRLAERLAGGADIVYLANPANPTGALMSAEEVLCIERECRRHGALLVVDEAFGDFTPASSVMRYVGRTRRMVVLRSMTKFFAMAGLRLGFLVAPKGIAARISRARAPWSVNTVALAAGLASLADLSYAERTSGWLKAERPRLTSGMEAAGPLGRIVTYPAGANFIMARLTGSMTAAELASLLFKRKILIRDLSSFRGLGPHYFRVGVRTRAENLLLTSSLSDLLS